MSKSLKSVILEMFNISILEKYKLLKIYIFTHLDIFQHFDVMKIKILKSIHNKIMYYQSKSERYYKIDNKKSVRVTTREGKDNLYQLNKLTLSELRTILPKKIDGNKEELLQKLIELIKKDDNMRKGVEKFLNNKNQKLETTQRPSEGDIVRIIIKPYAQGVTRVGVVKDVLTKKKVHTRGHKVRLHNDEIGRLIKIIKKKN